MEEFIAFGAWGNRIVIGRWIRVDPRRCKREYVMIPLGIEE
jgi:hypothetical protein